MLKREQFGQDQQNYLRKSHRGKGTWAWNKKFVKEWNKGETHIIKHQLRSRHHELSLLCPHNPVKWVSTHTTVKWNSTHINNTLGMHTYLVPNFMIFLLLPGSWLEKSLKQECVRYTWDQVRYRYSSIDQGRV